MRRSPKFRLSKAIHFSVAFALLLYFHSSAIHADSSRDGEGENDFNYVYGAVLGTGYYKSEAERLFILVIPISYQLPKRWSNTIATAMAQPAFSCSSREPNGSLTLTGITRTKN